MSPVESSRHVGRRPVVATYGDSGRTATSAVVLSRTLLVLLVLAALLCCGAAEPQPQGGDWNALSGMWGKRASDWNRLSGMWGKRAGAYGPYQALLLRAEEASDGAGHGISARAAPPGSPRENHWNDLSGYWG
ncbi:unnamed protein product [Ixodes pacificus]